MGYEEKYPNAVTMPFMFKLLISICSCSIIAESSVQTPPMAANVEAFSTELNLFNVSQIFRRDDYSCGTGKPCSNGACYGVGLFCGYGGTYCGIGCISNCDAVAEWGRCLASWQIMSADHMLQRIWILRNNRGLLPRISWSA